MGIRSKFHNSVRLLWALDQFLHEDKTDAEAQYYAWEWKRAEYPPKWTEKHNKAQ